MEDLWIAQTDEEAPWHIETAELGNLGLFGYTEGWTHSGARIILHEFWEIPAPRGEIRLFVAYFILLRVCKCNFHAINLTKFKIFNFTLIMIDL